MAQQPPSRFQPRAILDVLLAHEVDFVLGSLDVLADPDGAPTYAELKRAAGKPLPFEGVAITVASSTT